MRRFLLLAVVLSMLAVLTGVPAIASHTVPITITVQSTYAGLCGAKPGPVGLPPDWNQSLTDNANSAPANAKVPTDLWKSGAGTPLNDVSGPCDYGTDRIWDQTGVVGVRGTPNCNKDTRVPGNPGTPNPGDVCIGLHYPGLGPPVQPGRFLNFAKHTDFPPDAKNLCLFVSTGMPNAGTCTSLAVGYTFAVDDPSTTDADDPLEGSYCGTSRGFGWTFAIGTPSVPGQSVEKTWGIIEWTPTSAGSLLPLSGVVTAEDWKPNAHYTGWTGTKGKPSMRFANGTSKNVFALTSARSYADQIDVEAGTPGSCRGELNLGGVSFFNQSIAIAFGD